MDSVLDKIDYWEKLSELRVYSKERHRERYQICFLWKLSQGLVEGYTNTPLTGNGVTGGEGWPSLRISPALHLPKLNKPEKDHWLSMVQGSSTCCQSISEMRTRGTLPSSRIILTFSCQGSLISQPPQGWPGLLSPIVCWTKSPLFQTWADIAQFVNFT